MVNKKWAVVTNVNCGFNPSKKYESQLGWWNYPNHRSFLTRFRPRCVGLTNAARFGRHTYLQLRSILHRGPATAVAWSSGRHVSKAKQVRAQKHRRDQTTQQAKPRKGPFWCSLPVPSFTVLPGLLRQEVPDHSNIAWIDCGSGSQYGRESSGSGYWAETACSPTVGSAGR